MKQYFTRYIISFLFLIACLGVQAQTFTLKGRVIDDNGDALELASVSCLEQGKFTMTNLKGEFQMQLQSADSIVVRFSMVGFKPRQRVLRNPRTTQTLQVVLHSQEELEGVTIVQRQRQTTQMEQLDVKDLKTTPSASGNAVEELIQQQAGVSSSQ